MNTCPACSQPISSNDLACPKCGISLNPGTATAGPASGGTGKGLSVAAVIVMGLVGAVLLLGCLGSLGWFIYAPGFPMASKPTGRGFAAGSTIAFEEELEAIPEEMLPIETPESRNSTP
jgi:hypothetical protein